MLAPLHTMNRAKNELEKSKIPVSYLFLFKLLSIFKEAGINTCELK